MGIAVCNNLISMGTDMPKENTPGRGDIPALTPSTMVFDLTIPEGCKAELIYLTGYISEMLHQPEDGHPSQY